MIHLRGPWRGIDQFEMETLIWVDWWSIRRILEPLRYVSHVEIEGTFYLAQQEVAMEAVLT